jgi:hypothetical protein
MRSDRLSFLSVYLLSRCCAPEEFGHVTPLWAG